MDLKITINDKTDREALARRMLFDLRTSDSITEADFASSDAQDGDRGIIQDLGTVTLKLLEIGGASFIFDVLRPILSVGRSRADDRRSIILDLGNGNRLELQGGMSDEDFMATQNRMLSIMEAMASGDTT